MVQIFTETLWVRLIGVLLGALRSVIWLWHWWSSWLSLRVYDAPLLELGLRDIHRCGLLVQRSGPIVPTVKEGIQKLIDVACRDDVGGQIRKLRPKVHFRSTVCPSETLET